jgi:hypothetical protein
VKSREGFSGMIPTNICAHILFSIMQKYIDHGLNSKASLITQTLSSQIFRELTIKIQTWHYEIQKSILVKVILAQRYGISKLIIGHVCFDTQSSLVNTSKITTKVHFFFFWVALLGPAAGCVRTWVLRATVGCTMGCCVRPCCVGAATRVRGCSVRATVVLLVVWMRLNAPSAVERTMAGSSL